MFNIKLLGLSLIGCVLLSGCSLKQDYLNLQKNDIKKEHEYVILKTKNKTYEFNVDGENDKRILEQPNIKQLTKTIVKDLYINKKETLTLTDDIDIIEGNNIIIEYTKDTKKMNIKLQLTTYEYDEKKDIKDVRTEIHEMILEKDIAFLSKDHSSFTGVVWFNK